MREIGLRMMWLLAVLSGYLYGCGFGPAAPDPGKERAGPPHAEPVAHNQKAPTAWEPETEDLFVPEPSPSEPVKASMEVRPASVPAGSAVELHVAVRIARAHYLHAASDPGEKFTPLGVDVTLPPGIEGINDWDFTPPTTGRSGTPEYRGVVLLKRSLTVAPTVPPQAIVLHGELRFQACNDELCWPAGKMKLSAPLSILPKPR